MSIAEKLSLIAENMQKVYDAGVAKGGAGVRTESGTITLSEDWVSASGESYKVQCSNGAKLLDFHADEATLAAIQGTTGVSYLATCLGNGGFPKIINMQGKARSYASIMTEVIAGSGKWFLWDAATTCKNTDGFTFAAYAIKAGTYHWTAYYWDE